MCKAYEAQHTSPVMEQKCKKKIASVSSSFEGEHYLSL